MRYLTENYTYIHQNFIQLFIHQQSKMVRVVSQNFSPPRSRHSSGETDRDLAERANVALSVLGRKRVDFPEYESSSDSFWDSELDGDQCDSLASGNGNDRSDVNGNESTEKSQDVQSKRKERRRERNKLSAQAYRQRRRTQGVKEQQTLMELEAENKRLHRLVETLEKKTEHAKHLLRGCPLPLSVLQPIGELDGATNDMSDIERDPMTPQPNTADIHATCSGRTLQNPCSSQTCLNPTLPPPLFVNKLPHSSGINESHNRIPIPDKSEVPQFTYLAPSQLNSSACQALAPNNFFFNKNISAGANFPSAGTTNLAAVSIIPAILTVPVENQNLCYSNLNCKPQKACPPTPVPTNVCHVFPDNDINNPKPVVNSSAVFNTVWFTGGQMNPPSVSPGTVLGLVSVELRNDNINVIGNISANDANGNNKCAKNDTAQFSANPQPLSFNLNHQQHGGATTQDALCQEQIQVKHPVISVQYYLAPSDQVSVQ